MHGIVHIGAPKAGSSSIQRTIEANQEVLAEQGIYCFKPEIGPLGRSLSERFQRPAKVRPPVVQHQFRNIPDPKAWSLKCWSELSDQVASRTEPYALLSSEHFFNMHDPMGFLDALDEIFDDYTLILYLRDPVDHFTSHQDQQIRGGVKFSALASPVSYTHYNFTSLPEMLPRLGMQRLIARNFDRRNLVDGDVVADLASIIETIVGKKIEISVTPPRTNESLCGAATAWLLGQNEVYVGNAPRHVELRRRMIQRLRSSEALKTLPKLKLEHDGFRQILRYQAREKLEWYNRELIDGQVPFDLGSRPESPPDEHEARIWMRDWIFSYVTPEAFQSVVRAAVPLTQKDHDAFG